MVPSCFATCSRAALHHSKGFHSSARRHVPKAWSVAKLLDSKPSDPEGVVVNGWIRSIRNQKSVSFAAIVDGSSMETLQATLTPSQAESLSNGAAVRLTGLWRGTPKSKHQSHELYVQDVKIMGPSSAEVSKARLSHSSLTAGSSKLISKWQDYPLQKKYQSPENLRAMPHIRSRTPFNAAMLRLRSQSIAQLTRFFADRDFTQTHPPIVTSSDCEGAGEVFWLSAREDRKEAVSAEDDGSFFRSRKYLTVSSQLHLEALAQSVGDVWTLSPTFRAEKSETARHLSEFYMLEAEMPFIDDMSSLMDLIEDMLRNLTMNLYETQVGQEILHGARSKPEGVVKDQVLEAELEKRWKGMMAPSWPRISYSEAIEILQRSKFTHRPVWGEGLQAEHEKYIASTIGKGMPVFVTGYPKKIKPFYMLPSVGAASSQETVECFDLLVPEVCEIAGGSMREHRSHELLEAMREHKLIKDGKAGTDAILGPLKWYAELRQWGSVPHGGFGLGFDRLLAYLAGVPNVKEVVTFPRWVGRCDC
ncbi:hypothetical protein BP5796_07102 [Coleophoma crateriformis]|uniref:asparagine--tRNA ligase n=1 Tax=Coleophoma crateriformis TaxID=565419 RepID=A0A3D8RI65_9HELO|nr:hypothetical protein BP5796_07102 [Coleophoma crateriformis]